MPISIRYSRRYDHKLKFILIFSQHTEQKPGKRQIYAIRSILRYIEWVLAYFITSLKINMDVWRILDRLPGPSLPSPRMILPAKDSIKKPPYASHPLSSIPTASELAVYNDNSSISSSTPFELWQLYASVGFSRVKATRALLLASAVLGWPSHIVPIHTLQIMPMPASDLIVQFFFSSERGTMVTVWHACAPHCVPLTFFCDASSFHRQPGVVE
jgi:hypothetical protein